MCYTVGPCWLSILYIVVLHPFSGSLHNSELYKLQGSLIPVSDEEHGFEAGISGNAPCFLTAGPWTSDLTSRSLSYFILRGKLLSHVQLFATPWTVTCQAPLSMEFSRKKYMSGLPFSSPWDLPNLGIEPRSPALQADSLPSEPPGKPISF